ncbi:hypothetical protein [Tomitella gaofuii]|uniref:hypothetical protein n=1 Tax=Tomitella gaofuii TaxID=2760083 RepID=UPI0015F9E17A|nr:hypothetical protein [Tomitella gaofuii]
MSIFWFVLAALALIGAVALMYLDRNKPEPAVLGRRDWADARGLVYADAEPGFTAEWRRGVFEEFPHTRAVDVAMGLLDGAQMYVTDIEVPPQVGQDAAAAQRETVVCLQRAVGSPVVFDLRAETSPAPTEPEVHILGAVGRFFAFSNDLGVARRVCDRRMVAFAEAVPECVDTLWSEGDWTFAWLVPGASPDDCDDAVAALARFTSLLRVLPPALGGPVPRAMAHDPGSPRP